MSPAQGFVQEIHRDNDGDLLKSRYDGGGKAGSFYLFNHRHLLDHHSTISNVLT